MSSCGGRPPCNASEQTEHNARPINSGNIFKTHNKTGAPRYNPIAGHNPFRKHRSDTGMMVLRRRNLRKKKTRWYETRYYVMCALQTNSLGVFPCNGITISTRGRKHGESLCRVLVILAISVLKCVNISSRRRRIE